MARQIIASSIKARGLVLVVAIVAVAAGVVELRNAKVDSLPEFGPPTIEVRTEALGLSAPEVEQLITVPMEQDLLDGVGWLASIRSASLPGLSAIELTFEEGTNVLRARQLVQERLSQTVALPNVSAPAQMLQPASSTSRVLMVGLQSKKLSPIQTSVLAWWTIRPRLLGVRGVANVSIWGLRDRQLQVLVDPKRLHGKNVTLHQVLETAGNSLWASPLTFLEANTPGTGGFIDTPNQRLSVQHLQPITKAQDLTQIPIEGADAHLGDVADVVENHQPLIGDALVNGKPGLLIVVEKSPGANTLDVTHGVEDALQSMRPGLRGITIDTGVYRPATFLERTIKNTRTTIAVAIILLLAALVLSFAGWRRVAVVLAGVVLSFAVALLILFAKGVTLDMMVVAGLTASVCFVVADQVTLLARGVPAEDTRGGALFAALIVAVSVWPLFVLHGAAGAFFPRLAGSYLLAVGTSAIVALLATPALASFAFGSRPASEPRFAPRYERLVARTIRRPRAVIAASVALVLAGALVLPFFGRTLLPSFKDSALLIDWKAAPGTSLPEMNRITTRAAHELERVPGVRHVGAHVGRAVLSDEISSVDAAQLWVTIAASADHDATSSRVRRIVASYPGIDSHVVSYPNERLASVFTPPDEPVVIRLFGQDAAVMHRKAEEITRAISGVKGVVAPRVEQQLVEPTVRVEVNIGAAEAVGIKPGEVRRAAATMFQGTAVGNLFEDQKIFDVVVWSTPDVRRTLADVRNLEIDTPSDGSVRLGSVASVSVGPTPTVIRHDQISRTLDVTAAVKGRSVGAVLADVSKRVKQTRFPLEYHAEVVSTYGEERSARNHALAVSFAALLGIFLLIQAAVGTWRLAIGVAATVPVALGGGAVAGAIGAGNLSLGAVLAFFAVGGLVLYHALTVVRTYRYLERTHDMPFGADLVIRGTRDAFSAVAASTVAVAAFLLPLAIGGAAAGLEILQPLAVVLLGGVLAGAAAVLFLLPSVFLAFARPLPPDEEDEPDEPKRQTETIAGVHT